MKNKKRPPLRRIHGTGGKVGETYVFVQHGNYSMFDGFGQGRCAVQGNDFEEPEEAAKVPDLAPAPDAPARAENQRPRPRWRRLAASYRKSPRGGERPRRGSRWYSPSDNRGRVWPPGNDGDPLTLATGRGWT